MGETEAQILHVLEKGLKAEFEAIRFYLEKLEDLNYSKNKAAVDILILESVEHIGWLTKHILEIRKDEGKPLKRTAVQGALLEEFSMRGIYEFELKRTADERVRKLMERLIDEETKHETLVNALK